jgi:hypothetical protein
MFQIDTGGMIAAGLLCRHILFFASPRSITCLLIQKHSLCCSQFSWFYHCMDQKVTISRNWEMIDIIIDWLLVWNMNFMIFYSVGDSSSQLTKSYFFRGVGIPPTINGGLYSSWERHQNQWDTRWRPWHRHLSCFLGLVTFFSNMP